MRAIQHFKVEDLTDFVMIAGQNGSGKSCLFDAIRLLKSFYGGYQQDEYMQWFGEFSINVQDRTALRRLFRDPSRELVIKGVVEFAASEADYLRQNIRDLAWPIAWQRVTGQRLDPWTFNRMAIATQVQQFQQPVEQEIVQISADLTTALATESQTLSIKIQPDGGLEIEDCRPAEIAFQSYRPEGLGVIEYHSASRAYVRQDVGGISLDTRTFEDQRRQQMLYNWQGKYQNIKSELAGAYVRRMIAERSGGEPEPGEDLNATLEQLFQTFFPDKTYEGVRPTPGGGLEFPVLLQTGERHDIDDLSSGEKEILYGYLKLRNATPRNSVILLDEPELHLNPALLQGFPDFYHQHLGQAQGNQLWLVTHSDTLLRQTVGNTNYRVYHMVPATSIGPDDNQAAEVALDDEVDRVVIDLVGDLASYRPHAKVVILEGESQDGMDVTMVRRLFPDMARRLNLVSGGPKTQVRNLYRVLAEAVEQTGIVDRDSDHPLTGESGAQEYSWNVYHIENYLLDIPSVRAATLSLVGREVFASDDDVVDALRDCASLIVDRLVLERVQDEINAEFRKALNIGAAPDSSQIAVDLKPSIDGSASRVSVLASQLSLETLETRVSTAREELRVALEDGSWLEGFPGRLVLHRFAERHVGGVKYETLANVILGKMVERQVAPEGMRVVLERVLAA
jgi:predicted ATPase